MQNMGGDPSRDVSRESQAKVGIPDSHRVEWEKEGGVHGMNSAPGFWPRAGRGE